MIDTFSLMVSHGLILIALWRLLSRPDLDRESMLPDSMHTDGAPTDAQDGADA
ncbi:hypothetical protein [Sphingobium algorifonticola]|uniref:hypothetical protein n=1 Tax=Sphingobium algorifonticola TaxID=2008318 RepID=UPI0013E3BE85|nr:hypothetical protein [Sphingobium algorifonticola]